MTPADRPILDYGRPPPPARLDAEEYVFPDIVGVLVLLVVVPAVFVGFVLLLSGLARSL